MYDTVKHTYTCVPFPNITKCKALKLNITLGSKIMVKKQLKNINS